jgi:peptide/nickel transport system substrate-binding protein
MGFAGIEYPAVARVLGTALLASLSLNLHACAPSRDGGRIVIGVSSDVATLLPVLRNTALDGEINALLYLSLLSARWGDGSLEYVVNELSLAEDWTYNADSTALTFSLRKDAVWSDGQPIDAGDVVFTYTMLRDPTVASPYVDAWEYLDSVVAVNDRQVAFHFARRYPGMLFDTRIGIMPAHIFEAAVEDGSGLNAHPALVEPARHLVVSGPYRVAEWRRGERLVLEANPRAFTSGPNTERVVFRVIPDVTARLAELEGGGIDVLEVSGPLSSWQAESIRSDARWHMAAAEDRYYDYIAWNGARFWPFSRPAIREALSLAVDRGAIVEGLGIGDLARPAAGPYPPIFRRVADPDLAPDPYLPDSARVLLAAEGWTDRDGDGVVDRDGKPFRFTLLTPAGNQRRSSASAILQSQYARIGIEMRIRQLEFNALLDIVFERRDFEAVMLGWQVPLEHDYLVGHFWPADHPINMTGYASSALDSIIPRAEAAATEDLATAHWRAAARVIARDRPFAFLWYFDDVLIYSRRVANLRVDTYGLFQNLHQWRIER